MARSPSKSPGTRASTLTIPTTVHRLRQQTFIKGEWTDGSLYGLLAAEWES